MRQPWYRATSEPEAHDEMRRVSLLCDRLAAFTTKQQLFSALKQLDEPRHRGKEPPNLISRFIVRAVRVMQALPSARALIAMRVSDLSAYSAFLYLGNQFWWWQSELKGGRAHIYAIASQTIIGISPFIMLADKSPMENEHINTNRAVKMERKPSCRM